MALIALTCGLSSWKSWAMVAQASASCRLDEDGEAEGRAQGPLRLRLLHVCTGVGAAWDAKM